VSSSRERDHSRGLSEEGSATSTRGSSRCSRFPTGDRSRRGSCGRSCERGFAS
jgi:hypothetical protein